MAIIRFFKLPKPKQFEHIPIYYDPIKEEHELRDKRINNIQDKDIASDNFISHIKGSMHSKRIKNYSKTAKANFRTLIIIAVLIILSLYFFFS